MPAKNEFLRLRVERQRRRSRCRRRPLLSVRRGRDERGRELGLGWVVKNVSNCDSLVPEIFQLQKTNFSFGSRNCIYWQMHILTEAITIHKQSQKEKSENLRAWFLLCSLFRSDGRAWFSSMCTKTTHITSSQNHSTNKTKRPMDRDRVGLILPCSLLAWPA